MMKKKIFTLCLSAAVLVSTLQISAVNSNVDADANGKVVAGAKQGKAVADAVKFNLSEKEVNEIETVAKTDGKKAAERVNKYEGEYYEAAITSALTYYYENNDFAEYDEFADNVDARAAKYVDNFKKAAAERKDAAEKTYETGTVIVSFDKDTKKSEIYDLAKAEYGKCKEITTMSDGTQVAEFEISLGQTVAMAEDEYAQYGITNVAEPNQKRTNAESAVVTINDPGMPGQYYLNNINVFEAWNYIYTHSHQKVLVGVIDEGVDIYHDELKQFISPMSADITGETPVLLKDMATPYKGTHGTRVSGCIAGKANNGMGMAGVASAYNNDVVEILAIQAETCDSTGDYYTSYDLAKAVNYCMEQGVKVINMSLSGEGYSSIEFDAMENAKLAGITIVCAAGNSAGSEMRHPSDYGNTISVVATDGMNNLTDFSSYGMSKDVAAPGYGIYTTSTFNSFTTTDGTSFSSPITAAVVAMMYSVNPGMNFDSAYTALTDTTVDIGLGNKCRYGLVNAGAAVKCAAGAQYETQTAQQMNIPEVIGVMVSSPSDGMVNVVWGQDPERISLGLTYNVYINGRLWGTGLNCASYDFQTGLSGEVEVKVTSVLNGKESAGVVKYVDVKGTGLNVTTSPETTTTPEVTTTITTTTTTTNPVFELEVIGLLTSSGKDNTVNVVWGQDAARINSGCRYNVYVNGEKCLGNVVCGVYEITHVSAGQVTVKVTAVKDGAESLGITQYVTVNGEVYEIETTTPAQTTTEFVSETQPPVETTTEEVTTFNYNRMNGTSNVAYGKQVTASVNQQEAQNLVNGNTYDFWRATAGVERPSFSIDLGEAYKLAVLEMNFFSSENAKFTIYACRDGVAWRRINNFETSSTNRGLVDLEDIAYRYIKIEFDDTCGHILSQVRVWGTRNVVQLNPVDVTCSSVENNDYQAWNAFDGNSRTRWSSAWADRQWIKADFGEMKHIESVEIDWEAAYCSEYTVFFSDNGKDWAALVYGFKGQGGNDVHGNINWNARYMMISCTTRATVYGSSIYEVRVNGF